MRNTNTMPYLKIEKISEIIPLLHRGFTGKEISQYIKPYKSPQTIERWIRRLKEKGFVLPKRKNGRPSLKL